MQDESGRDVVTSVNAAIAYLGARGITAPDAAAAGMHPVDDAKALHPSFWERAALVIPYYDPAGVPTGFGRVRYFDPPEVGGLRKRAIRFQQPKDTAPEVYLPPRPGLDWRHVLADPAQPIIITEGEVKALSVTVHTGLPCMGLGGVFMFADNKMMLPLMEQTVWERRRVFVVFDSDIDSKVGVQLAESRLATWLLAQRAVVHTCRLPPSPSGEKQGADDYIVANGAAAFTAALQSARSLTDLDLRVLELNSQVAYLDGEEKLIELATGNLIRKDSFLSGSRYSTVKVPMQKGERITMVSAAQAWLTHPLATRYANTLFRPGGDHVITEGGQTWLNSWREQPAEPGDVSLYLDLTRYLFEDTLGHDWDFPVRLLAYKAQNPTIKIPLAVMLIGEQGSGKSLWGALSRSAFGEYGASRSGKDLGQDWNGFLEKSLLVTIDDVSTRQMRTNIETLRSWISEPRVERHEKYLKNREVDNYALLIFTSNFRDAGAFAHDDRRFLVVGAPTREHGAEYYDPIYKWLRSGQAGSHLYHYLLTLDLQGWTPPITAPVTAEKRMAFEESLSPFERLARDMRESDANVVVRWLQAAEQWALAVLGTSGHVETTRANEVMSALPYFPIRPWYTAEELCRMFPHMLEDLKRDTQRYTRATLPGRVSTQLRNNGIYFLRNTESADGFLWSGRVQQFLIVCPSAGYPREMTQAEFDAAMAQMSTYTPFTRMS